MEQDRLFVNLASEATQHKMKPSLILKNYFRPDTKLTLGQKTPSGPENYSGFNYLLILALALALISHYYYIQNLDSCTNNREGEILEDTLFYTIRHAGANT